MNPDRLRTLQDKILFEQLMANPAVQEVNQQIQRREKEGPLGTRRRLLSTAVKLSKNMSPHLTAIADQCIEKLEVSLPVELYAYNSPQFNAACVKPEEGKLFIMFSSSLLDAFDKEELLFVMGHELGHFIYQHHSIPVGYLLRGNLQIGPELALKLSSWSRYAEFSADRAGAFCVNSLEAVGRSLFKLASGVSSSIVSFDLADFLRQVDEMKVEDESAGSRSSIEDWFMTHPFSPLRVKALQLFHKSELMSREGGASVNDMEAAVEGLMGLMEPSYLEAKTDTAKAMRHLLFAGALTVANADGHISEAEIKAFESFFGHYQFNESLDFEKLLEKLPVRAERVVKLTGTPKRMQILRDLCVVAKAEGEVGKPEKGILVHIAQMLELPEYFVDQSLNMASELD